MTTRRYIAKDVEPDPCGDFVYQEDHAVVEAERDALAVQVEQLQSELRSVATAANECGWNGVENPKIRARVAELEAADDVVSPDGGEAEELRSGIEQLMELGAYDGVSADQLQELLDRVDARDSLATMVEQDRLRRRVAELEAMALTHGWDECCRLADRIRELESPPVVPEGWVVRKIGAPEWRKWEALHNGKLTSWCGHGGDLPIIRALAWAIEHDDEKKAV